MQLIDVIDSVRQLLSEPLDSGRTFPDNTSSFYTDSQFIVYHNLVQQELANDVISVHEDYFVTQTTLSLVAGTAEYNLPSGTIKVRRVEDIRNSSVSVEIPPTTINQRGGFQNLLRTDSTASVMGGGYYIRGNQIVLEDTPTVTNASAVRLHIVKAIPDVSAGTNASELPVEHHRVIVYGMYLMALVQQQSNPDAITWATREYDKRRTEMRAQLESRQIQRPRKVVRTYERGYL